MTNNYCVSTDEILKIMDKLKCNKLTFTENSKVYANDTEIDLWQMLYEIRRTK